MQKRTMADNRFTVDYEGLSKAVLMQKILEAGIKLNTYAQELISSEAFIQSSNRYSVRLLETSIGDIGLVNGGNFKHIIRAMQLCKLTYCPLEVAPYIRLIYTDQPRSEERTVNRNPPDSITIFNEPRFQSDDLPTGFYLRNIEGTLWLRAYKCSDDYHWLPTDQMIFQLAD